jgi:hypothetical protein
MNSANYPDTEGYQRQTPVTPPPLKKLKIGGSYE